MASYLVQAGSTLYHVSTSGVATAITLPSGIALVGASNPCRALVFGAGQSPVIVVVNGATHDFYIDVTGTARQLQITPPTAAPIPSAGNLTGLTGSYAVACTFKIKDANGATIAESGIGPISAGSSALTNQSLALANIPVSGDTFVNARGLYRTLSGGNVLYPWFDLDNNVSLTDDRGVSDALLSLLPTTAVRNGVPPDLSLICTWKDRLWGVPKTKIDYPRWTDERLLYGWSADNEILIPAQQTDSTGVTAFIPRRDQLGIARHNRLYQITGDSNDTFQRVEVSETIGAVGQESVVVVRDIGYWIGDRGAVEWTNASIGYISEAQVDPWFTTDTYFNRSLFPKAQGRYNPDTDAVEWLLASAGSTNLDRWIAFDIKGRRWFGPHKTDAFIPTCSGHSSDGRGVLGAITTTPITVFGGADGYLYQRDRTQINDDDHTPVALSVDLPVLGGFDPSMIKTWGQPMIHTRAETQGTLTLTPIVGEINDSAQDPIDHDLTIASEVLPRLGSGRYAQINLSHSSLTEGVRINGLELPFVGTGRH